MIDGIKTYGSTDLIEKLQECDDPVFIVTIGTTETSKIPGISGAGATPELTVYTPAADAEFMVLGEVRCTETAAETVVDGAAAPTLQDSQKQHFKLQISHSLLLMQVPKLNLMLNMSASEKNTEET